MKKILFMTIGVALMVFGGCTPKEKPVLPDADKDVTTVDKDDVDDIDPNKSTTVTIYDRSHINAGILNPLAELGKCVFNSADRLVIDKIDILQKGQRTNFANNSGEQTGCHFCIVSND